MSARGPAPEPVRLRRQIRWLLGFFIFGLIASGLTAFPLLTELRLLCSLLGLTPEDQAATHTGLAHWLLFVREGLTATYAKYPFIGYGTDWLAFGHVIIALFFIAPWRHPGQHLDVIKVGIAACVLVVPLALICGPIRGIPFYWRLIDCAFGLGGIIPLWLVLRLSRHLHALEGQNEKRPSR